MKKVKYGLLYVILLGLSTTLTAQVEFNDNGLLLKALPTKLKKNEKYQIIVHGKEKGTLKAIRAMEARIRLIDTLISTTDFKEQLDLELRLAMLYNFFLVSKSKEPCIKNYLTQLDKDFRIQVSEEIITTLIAEQSKKPGFGSLKINCSDADCICLLAEKYLGEIASIESRLQELQQRRLLARDLFCDYQPLQKKYLFDIETKNGAIGFLFKDAAPATVAPVTEPDVSDPSTKAPAGAENNEVLERVDPVTGEPFSIRDPSNDSTGKDTSSPKASAPQEKPVAITQKPKLVAAPDPGTRPDFLPDQLDYKRLFKANDQALINTQFDWETSRFEGDYTTRNKFALELRSTDQVKALLINWHNKTASLISPDYIKEVRDLLATDTKTITFFQNEVDQLRTAGDKARESKLSNILEKLKKYDQFWCLSSPIVQYLRQWFWFSGGNYSLNYIGFSDPDHFESVVEEQKKMQLQEKMLKEQIAKIESIINCIACREPGLDTLQRMQAQLKTKKNELEKLQKDQKELIEDFNTNKKTRENLLINAQFLHRIELPVEQPTAKQWIIYHDASNDLEIISLKQWQVNKKIILPDDYTVYFGMMNAPKPAGDLTITEDLKAFNDSAGFLRDLGNAFGELGKQAAPLAKLALSGDPLLNAIVGAFKSSKGSVKEAASGRTDAEKAANEKMLRMVREIDKRLWRFALLQRMVAEYDKTPLAPEDLESIKDEEAALFTYGIKAKQQDPPYTNHYTIKKDDKALIQEKYSIGREKVITLGAGIFFNSKSARQQTVDTTNGGFSVKNTDNKAKFVGGVKIFPFKAFEADASIFPRFPLKRLSIFAGFEILKPLENLYTGIGYDLVPGLQFTSGIHIYRRDAYGLENNQVTSKSTDYKVSGAYYGVTLDPIVLTQFLSNFLK